MGGIKPLSKKIKKIKIFLENKGEKKERC